MRAWAWSFRSPRSRKSFSACRWLAAGGLVVAGQALHGTEIDEGVAPAVPVTDVPVERQSLLQTFGGGGVVAGLRLKGA